MFQKDSMLTSPALVIYSNSHSLIYFEYHLLFTILKGYKPGIYKVFANQMAYLL